MEIILDKTVLNVTIEPESRDLVVDHILRSHCICGYKDEKGRKYQLELCEVYLRRYFD